MISDRYRFWAWPEELRKAGVLGINHRNVGYILSSNPRGLYPRVDDKLVTKQICQEHGIPVPDTYGVLIQQSHVKCFPEIIGERQEFVIKPASGAAGRGIIVIARRRGEDYITPSRRVITWSDLRYHIATSLSGLYSLGGQVDKVIIEQRIISHEALNTVSVGGTPDIRVILYHGVPAMAMIRLPTRRSGGRANLHQGAAAAAVDLITGKTFGGVMDNRMITHHPDTEIPIAGIEIPNWRHLMEAAMKLSDALQMGYVGVDFVIDANQGPVVLEANARPGLAIQVAHGQGIIPRLSMIAAAPAELRRGSRRWELVERICGAGPAA